MLRDPVDRAYSNWMHLWMDGLEPRADIVEAVSHEQKRVDAGWAPFWHYRGLGMYGRQVKDLFDHFPREQVLLLRYKNLVDHPDRVLNRVCDFLGVEGQEIETIPSDNSRPFVRDGVRARTRRDRSSGPVRQSGQFLPPQVWRKVSKPLISQLHKGGDASRPKLTPEQRELLVAPHREDIALLEELTGESFAEWTTYREGSSFESRRTPQAASQRRDQVVRAVGAGQLEVEAGRAVRLGHRRRVAQGTVGVGRAQHGSVRVGVQHAGRVGPRDRGGLVPVVLGGRASVVQHHQRVVGQHRGHPGATRVPGAGRRLEHGAVAGPRRGRRRW